ncbi:MAG: DUF1802 family protein [Nitrospirota bacterium]
MLITNTVGLKEWAVIIEALLSGRQIILLRKGGISEEEGRFSVDYREFFLYPTYTHQQGEGIKEREREFLKTVRPKIDDYIELRAYATVVFAAQLKQWEEVAALEPFHIWSAEEIRNRFDRREPDLTVLGVRVYRLSRVIPVLEEPRFAGCRSWVTLESSVVTDNPTPVLTEKKFLEKLSMVRRALAGKRE